MEKWKITREIEEKFEEFDATAKKGNEMFLNTKFKFFEEEMDVKNLLSIEHLLKEEKKVLESQEPEELK